jgi:hypothetical protein
VGLGSYVPPTRWSQLQVLKGEQRLLRELLDSDSDDIQLPTLETYLRLVRRVSLGHHVRMSSAPHGRSRRCVPWPERKDLYG